MVAEVQYHTALGIAQVSNPSLHQLNVFVNVLLWYYFNRSLCIGIQLPLLRCGIVEKCLHFFLSYVLVSKHTASSFGPGLERLIALLRSGDRFQNA